MGLAMCQKADGNGNRLADTKEGAVIVRLRKLVLTMTVLFLAHSALGAAKITIYPAPKDEVLSTAYKIQVDGHDVPVYPLQVAPEDNTLRLKEVDHLSLKGAYSDEAAFGYFDSDGDVQIVVTYKEPVTFARALPASSATQLKIQGSSLRFSAKTNQNVTIEVNHQVVRTLHIFINPTESNTPSPKDANVLYFGPGTHELTNLTVPQGKTILYFGPGLHTLDNLVVHDGQTVYIAGGAVIRSVIRTGEPWINDTYNNETTKFYKEPAIKLSGSGIKLRGRGILDGTPSMGKRLLSIEGQNISLDGIILKNSGNWFMPIWYSDHVVVTNLKILGYRGNSDGIDIYSSRDVTVSGCFIRTVDDLIVIKSQPRNANAVTDTDKVKTIVVRGNRLWNETGTAMTIGTAVGADISDVSFTDNDVIRDLARGADEGINLSGSGTVSDVRFDGNRIDRTDNPNDWGGASRVIYAYIRHSPWEAAGDKGRPFGKIRTVAYSNTQVATSPKNPKIRIELQGASAEGDIEDIKFANITINGKPLSKSNIVLDEKFVSKVVGLP